MDILDRSVARAPQAPLDPTQAAVRTHLLAQHVHGGVGRGEGLARRPDRPLWARCTLAPSAMVFHYGQEIFEGLKAFRHPAARVHAVPPGPQRRPPQRLRRAHVDARDPGRAAARGDADASSAIDRDWVPPAPGYALPPPGDDRHRGRRSASTASKRFLYFIITGPTGPYFGTGTQHGPHHGGARLGARRPRRHGRRQDRRQLRRLPARERRRQARRGATRCSGSTRWSAATSRRSER